MSKIKAGWYEANKPITIVTSLNFKTKKSRDGTIEKTYGVWANDPNSFIKLPNVQQLIENNILKRVYKD